MLEVKQLRTNSGDGNSRKKVRYIVRRIKQIGDACFSNEIQDKEEAY